VERAAELEILAPSVHDFHKNETLVLVGAAEGAHQWLKKRAMRRNKKEGAACCEGSQSVERLGKTQLYPLAKSHQWLKRRSRKKDKERRYNGLQGIAVCCIMLWVMAMCPNASQCAAACCDELLCVAARGGVLQVADSRAGVKRAAERHGVLQHVMAHCNMLRQWMWQPKKKKKGKKEVVTCSKVAQGVAKWCQRLRCVIVCSGWLKRVTARCSVLCVVAGSIVLLFVAVCCNALKWVASIFGYMNLSGNRYVNRNECVHRDKCIWSTGECMKAKANHW